ncbi:MAG TPA: heme exporter protein CcmB [Kofleriaceae bacterium]|nr:heme exporter protein CcmB [Kofleriaceae bacterium]
MDFLRHVATIAGKDLRVELRSREIIFNMAFFAAMIVVLFSFAFLKEAKSGLMVVVAEVTPGFVWIAVLFSATIGMGRAFDRERESDTMRGLLLSPAPRAAIFLGKAAGLFLLMAMVEVVVVPMVWLFFGSPLFDDPVAMGSLVVLATAGVAVIGSVFAAMLMRTRARDVLLPVVLYPILVPLFIAAIKGTSAILGDMPDDAWFWIRFLLVYDALFVVTALWTFESVVIE